MLKIRKLECLGTEIKHKEWMLWGIGMGIKEMRKKKNKRGAYRHQW